VRYIWQHIETIINTYNGGVPLTHFLKNYYKLHPKLGSRDRKILSEMAYCWYRCGKGFDETLPLIEKLPACLFLCETQSKHTMQFLPEQWQVHKEDSIASKLDILNSSGISFNIDKLVSFAAHLSQGIDEGEWKESILTQPDFFIRTRKNVPQILNTLKENNIPFEASGNCIAMANGVSVEQLLPVDAYVVQDASSQKTGEYFKPHIGEQWWDCCSGAGGKSLLLKDIENNIELTVSDKRQSILHNLATRFKQYHHKAPVQHILDAANAPEIAKALGNKKFDKIICDVPCTGSGTWARTPEQLYYFEDRLVEEISQLQLNIATNASKYLKPGGTLYYITCSVFQQENEGVVEKLATATGLVVKEMQLINGMANKADSMFITILQKR
jgi:16S rRNA (cytosine967-C5)-methyltransferase